MENIVAGVDIGGTHVTVCLVDISKGELLQHTRTRISIDPSMNKEDVIKAWSGVIQDSFEKGNLPIGKVGIAMPGPFDYEKGISLIKGLEKYESLYGENVKTLLSAQLGIEPADILMINDASAFLVGEWSCGAGKGYKNWVGITLGTGLGSAAYYNNKLEEGDLYCFDYKDAKAEDYLSARWLLGTYEKHTGIKLEGVKELAEKAASETIAQQVFCAFGHNLGNVLVKRYNRQNPEVVVIGGNIAKAWAAFIPSAIKALEQAGKTIELKPAQLGEDAALIGASYLWSLNKNSENELAINEEN